MHSRPAPRTSLPAPARGASAGAGNRRIWLSYAAACALAWGLFVLAGTEFERGLDPLWLAVYQATLTLCAPMLMGAFIFPWSRWLLAAERAPASLVVLHGAGALVFSALWQASEFGLNAALFGLDHATAMLSQALAWRALWGGLVYAAIVTAFSSVLQARRARAAAVATAQAESALARAELAAISGKLNPHFLFNTLNSLIALTRKDAKAAEAALLTFASMLRYVLDTKRGPARPQPGEGALHPEGSAAGGAAERVTLADELAFLRDYLALEALRLGTRLRVDWQIDDTTLQDEVPPLTLQPLVENSVLHGVAPRTQGGTIRIAARRNGLNQGLDLCVADDGPGCEPARLEQTAGRRGIGLAALRKRFALDFNGQARLRIHTAPGAGFRVDIWIPQA